jgi:hypothetical protein
VNELTTREILYRAIDLLERPTSETAGLWPRATAVLARQALERGLTETLSGKVEGLHSEGRGSASRVVGAVASVSPPLLRATPDGG